MKKIITSFNKVPMPPISKLSDINVSTEYAKEIPIDLNRLAATYLIEEFDDHNMPTNCEVYSALRYLKKNTDYFVFDGKHPGANKDSRRENSRILGQTFTRYFINEFLDTHYVANISTCLDKNLGQQFNNVKISRSQSGDTPDFIAAKSPSDIFLAESKGRRIVVPFSDKQYDEWRNQFDRVSVSINNQTQRLKGYILQIAIANDENRYLNSHLLVEDPETIGEMKFESNNALFRLVKSAHYCDLLSKMGFGFIGGALVYTENFADDSIFFVPRFKLKTKNEDRQYTGILYSQHGFTEYPSVFYDRHYDDRRSRRNYGRQYPTYFFGLELNIFQSLLEVARGNPSKLDEVLLTARKTFNESVMFFSDGSIICDANLVDFRGVHQM